MLQEILFSLFVIELKLFGDTKFKLKNIVMNTLNNKKFNR